MQVQVFRTDGTSTSTISDDEKGDEKDEALLDIEAFAKRTGMKLNANKTKCMVVNFTKKELETLSHFQFLL